VPLFVHVDVVALSRREHSADCDSFLHSTGSPRIKIPEVHQGCGGTWENRGRWKATRKAYRDRHKAHSDGHDYCRPHACVKDAVHCFSNFVSTAFDFRHLSQANGRRERFRDLATNKAA